MDKDRTRTGERVQCASGSRRRKAQLAELSRDIRRCRQKSPFSPALRRSYTRTHSQAPSLSASPAMGDRSLQCTNSYISSYFLSFILEPFKGYYYHSGASGPDTRGLCGLVRRAANPTSPRRFGVSVGNSINNEADLREDELASAGAFRNSRSSKLVGSLRALVARNKIADDEHVHRDARVKRSP